MPQSSSLLGLRTPAPIPPGATTRPASGLLDLEETLGQARKLREQGRAIEQLALERRKKLSAIALS